MAEATVNRSSVDHTESAPSSSSAAAATAMFLRNDDSMTRALRSEGPMNLDQITDLHRHATPAPTDVSSEGTFTASVFSSSHKPSTGTKPTSAGTSYPVEGYKGKGKATATYASSNSATHGSGSDTEQEVNQENALLGLGYWTGDGALKGWARAKKRPRPIRRQKHKKPVVIIQQDGMGKVSDVDDDAVEERISCPNRREAKYLRQRRGKPDIDQLNLAEEGRVDEDAALSVPLPQPLSRTRFYVLIGLVLAIVLTFALFGFAAHHFGKGRMECTEGVIFAGALLISCFTVLAMIVARRNLQEALFAGFFEFCVGFALVIKIHDFM